MSREKERERTEKIMFAKVYRREKKTTTKIHEFNFQKKLKTTNF